MPKTFSPEHKFLYSMCIMVDNDVLLGALARDRKIEHIERFEDILELPLLF